MIYEGENVTQETMDPEDSRMARAKRTGPHLEKMYPGDFLSGYQERRSYRERTLNALTDLGDKVDFLNNELDSLDRHVGDIRSASMQTAFLTAVQTGILAGILVGIILLMR